MLDKLGPPTGPDYRLALVNIAIGLGRARGPYGRRTTPEDEQMILLIAALLEIESAPGLPEEILGLGRSAGGPRPTPPGWPGSARWPARCAAPSRAAGSPAGSATGRGRTPRSPSSTRVPAARAGSARCGRRSAASRSAGPPSNSTTSLRILYGAPQRICMPKVAPSESRSGVRLPRACRTVPDPSISACRAGSASRSKMSLGRSGDDPGRGDQPHRPHAAPVCQGQSRQMRIGNGASLRRRMPSQADEGGIPGLYSD